MMLESTGEEREPTPGGIKFVSVLWGIGAVLSIALGIFTFAAGMEPGFGAFSFFGFIQLSFGVAQLVAVLGLWRLCSWSWKLVVTLLWIGLLFSGISILMGSYMEIVRILINVLWLVYFHHRRALFVY